MTDTTPEGLDALFNRPSQPPPDTDNLEVLFGGKPTPPFVELPEEHQAMIGYMQAIISQIEAGNIHLLNHGQRALADMAFALAEMEDLLDEQAISLADLGSVFEDDEEADEDDSPYYDDEEEEEGDPCRVNCPQCEGTGQFRNFDNGTIKPCLTCDGTGWIDTDDAEDGCPFDADVIEVTDESEAAQ